jgi:hypothetical protein
MIVKMFDKNKEITNKCLNEHQGNKDKEKNEKVQMEHARSLEHHGKTKPLNHADKEKRCRLKADKIYSIK